jgi:hypothetical protein
LLREIETFYFAEAFVTMCDKIEIDKDGNKKCVYLEVNGSVIEKNRPTTAEMAMYSNVTLTDIS